MRHIIARSHLHPRDARHVPLAVELPHAERAAVGDLQRRHTLLDRPPTVWAASITWQACNNSTDLQHAVVSERDAAWPARVLDGAWVAVGGARRGGARGAVLLGGASAAPAGGRGRVGRGGRVRGGRVLSAAADEVRDDSTRRDHAHAVAGVLRGARCVCLRR